MKRQKYKIINQRFLILFTLLLFCFVLGVLLPVNAKEDSLSLKQAYGFIAQKKWEQAISLLEKEVQNEPFNETIQKQLISLYLLSGKKDKAQILVEKNLMLYPDRVEPLQMQAIIKIGLLVEEGSTAEEEQKLIDLVKISQKLDNMQGYGSNAEKMLLKGVIERLKGNNKVSEDYFSRVLYQDSNHIQALQMLIDLHTQNGETKMATPMAMQAIDLNPYSTDTYYLIGKLFLKKGDPARALNYFNRSEEFDPMERPKRLYYVAKAQHQIGKTSEAAETYRKLLYYWPDRSDVWLSYAQLMDNLGDSDSAINAYQKAYALEPDVLNPFLSQAELVFWTQPVIKAYPLYRRIYQIAPERRDILELMVGMQYYLWQHGVLISNIDLDELEQWLKQHESKAVDLSLQAAKLQLKVLKDKNWMPTSKLALNSMVEQAEPSFIKAESYILLDMPDKAQQIWSQLKAPDDFRYVIQRLVIVGAWPWAEKTVNQRGDIISVWVKSWADNQFKQSNEQLSNARMFIKANRLEEALMSLQKAKAYSPLSTDVQICFAEIYLKQDKLDEAKRALEISSNLGIPAADSLQFMELKKQLEIAYLRKLKKNKQ